MGTFWCREASKFWDVDSNPANRSVKFQPFFGKVEGDMKAFQDVSKKNYFGPIIGARMVGVLPKQARNTD